MQTLNAFFNENKKNLPMSSLNTFKSWVNNIEDLKKCFEKIKVGKSERYFVKDKDSIFKYFNQFKR